jgi:hypothetical protein
MNPDDINDVNDMIMATGTVTVADNGQYSFLDPTTSMKGYLTGITTNGSSINTISTMKLADDELLDKWIMNRVTIDHKVQEQELMKLKEVAPDYANEIKETLSRNAARDMIKKMTFTKKHDKDADVHHFIGRVWCFTEQELQDFIKDIRGL